MLVYDDEGNIIGERSEPEGSPLSQYMGGNIDYWHPKSEHDVDPAVAEVAPMFTLMNLDQIRELPDPEWLVEKYLQVDSFGVLFGPPGSTKSFWALDIACSIASGIEFNGHQTKQGQVLYAAGEGLRGFKWRIEAWLLAHPEVDEATIKRNLYVIPEVPHLLEKQHVAMLHNTARYLNDRGPDPLRLTIVDTWARSLVGGDENSQKDVGLAIDACETVRKQTGSSVLVVHHTGADGLRERGSTALRAAADTSIMAQHDEATHSTSIVIKKMKDSENGMVSRYQLRHFGHSIVLAPLAVNTPVGNVQPKPTVRDRQYYIDRANERNNPDNPF
jgi:RecA-family ATPase